uniref:Putative secreted protein n=1 Tax=Amblyomma cajennense TaxID=34607 RepID=A0A023FTT5_AMBCJ
MFFTCVAAASVLFSMGLGNPAPTNSARQCPPPAFKYSKMGSMIVRGHTQNCTCDLGGGVSANYPDGTPCFGQNTDKYKIGNCSAGVCKVASSSYGCEGKIPGQNGTTVYKNLCYFECDMGERKEWAFSPEGTPCVNEDDGSEEENRKNGTCKSSNSSRPEENKIKETVCIPNEKLNTLGC